MDSQRLKVIAIVVVAAIAALYLGIAAATEQMEAIAWVVGVFGIVILFGLGRHVWALIPILGGLSGYVNAVPGSPSAWYLGVALAGGMLALRFAMRSKDFIWRWTWLDTLVLLQVLVLAQAYLRNPTGFALLGGDVVGGKPYVEYAIAIGGFFCMAFVRTDFAVAKKVILAMILVQLADSLLLAFSSFSPSFALAVGRLYSNVDYSAASSLLQGGNEFSIGLDTRFASFKAFAALLGLICFSFYRPATCLMPVYPKRFLLFALSLVAMLFSGFRSGLLKIGFLFVTSSAIRRRPIDIFVAGLVGVTLLAGLVAFGQIKKLPFSAQRVLSFLPVEVDPEAKDQAEGSSEWRFEMWKLVLTSDRYIKNKLIGDGFGFSAAEQRASLDAQEGRTYLTQQQMQDFFIAKGSYHGFHVETIRFTGALGLTIATFILIYFAVRAYRIVRHYETTSSWGYVMFICIPFIVDPFFYWVVFGSYKSGFVTYLLSAGMLKMLDNVKAQELAAAHIAQHAAPVSTKDPRVHFPRGSIPTRN